MKYILSLLVGVVSMGLAHAEVVEWTQNETIHVPVDVSLVHRDQRPRLIYFPSPSIAFNQDWSSDDIEVTQTLNGLQITLKNPRYKGVIHVLGSDGAIYPVSITPNTGDEPVSNVLQVIAAPQQAERVQQQPVSPQQGGVTSIDGEVISMVRHMVGGETYSWITSAADGAIVGDSFQTGRRIYESDVMSIYSYQTYRGIQTVGYQTLVTYKGEKPVQLNFQRLYFPNLLAIHASKQVLLDPKTPGLKLEPNDKVIVWFVARASDGGR